MGHILMEPVCQWVSGVYVEACCQRWWSSVDTRAHRRPTSPDRSRRDLDSADESNRNQTARPATILKKPISVLFYTFSAPFNVSCIFLLHFHLFAFASIVSTTSLHTPPSLFFCIIPDISHHYILLHTIITYPQGNQTLVYIKTKYPHWTKGI